MRFHQLGEGLQMSTVRGEMGQASPRRQGRDEAGNTQDTAGMRDANLHINHLQIRVSDHYLYKISLDVAVVWIFNNIKCGHCIIYTGAL